MNDEKFISIEYEVWKNKYLPLERQVKILEVELEKEKKSKEIRLYMEVGTARYKVPIGFVDFHIEGGPLIKIGRKKELELAIVNELRHSVKFHFVTHKELLDWLDKIKTAETNLFNKQELNRQKIKQIPKIIRWIFKIK